MPRSILSIEFLLNPEINPDVHLDEPKLFDLHAGFMPESSELTFVKSRVSFKHSLRFFLKQAKVCAIDDCDNKVKRNGVCWRHGGFRQCTLEGCNKSVKARGLCWAHGGGKPCQALDCTTPALRYGFCWAHGGGKRCEVSGCTRPAYKRRGNLCSVHWQGEE
ncbi:hypothetical protein Ae201684_018920 [Aphanomyces euteiches]|uniref:WRKY19-like zinc finger domain-containing protein n=1 Tax=Aphanomyces euteiches TaxID=100861 RepID=A0A6G0W5N8_9STRA|nr:hypothetical protein Ae201684_018920 [Aphanomyces euteiches]KAH9134095.1 hypothetical protein AeRB84_020042 [Aphanomyces euteiches]